MLDIKQEAILKNLVESAIHPRGNKGNVAQSSNNNDTLNPSRNIVRDCWSCMEGLCLCAWNPLPRYSGIVFLNLFRGRDTLPITATMLQMLFAAILIPLPFYIWPGMNLLTNPSGMAPLLYMLGFTLGLGYVISASRDKPWLMVFTTTATLSVFVLGGLYILQTLDLYAGWDILVTGGFYFSKNKVFSTIGEAQAPDRGILFASFGPIVTIAAIGYGLILIWRGKERRT